MAFGVHLLAKNLAKSDDQVMKILQTHVDELDGVLERTNEDFLIVDLDVHTRIQYLSLPLKNLALFDDMLQDRNFRLSLVAYNDQIEHAVERFTLAITDALKDLHKGKEATSALWLYMIQLADEGCFRSESIQPFYQAMMDNLEGWLVAFWRLRRRGAVLLKALRQLAFAINEMQKRVGIASRRDVVSHCRLFSKRPRLILYQGSIATVGSPRTIRFSIFAKRPTTSGSRPMTSGSRPMSSNKPLPRDPSSMPRRSMVQTPTVQTPTAVPNANSGNETPRLSEHDKRQSALQYLNRAKSCSALVATEAPSGQVTPPRTPGRLSRKLSKPFLSRRSTTINENNTQNRPSTAPSRELKSRSTSIEQLKSFWANRPASPPSPPQEPAAGIPFDAEPPTSPRLLQRADTMKEQISQYLKTDRVVDAWDNMAQKTGRSLTKSAKEWPSSVFRAKSTDNLRIWRKDKGLSPSEMERQLAWAREEENLKTYSFKRRPSISPRIHVVSVQMILDEDTSFGEEIIDDAASIGGDSCSFITALPPLNVPSGPQTVHCQG